MLIRDAIELIPRIDITLVPAKYGESDIGDLVSKDWIWNIFCYCNCLHRKTLDLIFIYLCSILHYIYSICSVTDFYVKSAVLFKTCLYDMYFP